MKLQLNCALTSREACDQAAERWLRELQNNPRAHRTYTVALSGGRIVTEFFGILREKHTRGLPIPKGVHFFWADERCVPPDHDESNFRLANDELFGPLHIPAERVHRIRGEIDPKLAVEQADAELRSVSGRVTSERVPILDMVFLGMGEDGHTASLFPESPAIQPHVIGDEPGKGQLQAYVAVVGPKPPPNRVSLTYESLSAAESVWALISGSGKGAPLTRVLLGEEELPMGRVVRERASTVLWTDAFF